MSALSTMMRHFEEMRVAQLPSQSNQSTSAHPPFCPNVVYVHALAGAPLVLFPPPSAPTPIPHAEAYAMLVTASHSNPQNTAPVALPTLSTVAGPADYPANQSNTQTASPFEPPTLSAVPGAAAFAPNPPTIVSPAELTVYLGALAVCAGAYCIYCKWAHCVAARSSVCAARTRCGPACSAPAGCVFSICNAAAGGTAHAKSIRCVRCATARGTVSAARKRCILCGPVCSASAGHIHSIGSAYACGAARVA